MSSFQSVLLVTFLSAVVAFTPTVSVQHRRTLSPLFAAPAPPSTTTITTTTKQTTREVIKQKNKFKTVEGGGDTDIEDAPLWMLFLIADNGYDQNHVVGRLSDIVEDIDQKRAIECYEAAQRVGEAMCGKYQHEHAEQYAEQLTRSDPIIYAEVSSCMLSSVDVFFEL
jgi:ATP-dependent Clp protease adapter protein ClpS